MTEAKERLMAIIHIATHPGCTDPDCFDGIYTDEGIADSLIAAGWRPPEDQDDPS